ncbi:MAG TPA: HD domain-containing phosphohydrolase [Solirubrobacteraceae bacterium]|nr:HD domain-containing phosphohydrolase [Solirubrobacteraceae bacterium]
MGAPSVDEVPSGQRTRRRDTFLIAGQSVLLAAALVGAVLGTGTADWEPASLFVSLLALALVGQFLSLRTGTVQIGPAFIATALAMALLGPAPAAVIAVAAVLAWSVKARTPRTLVFNNVVALTTYPVAGALVFEALGDPGADEVATFSTAAIVFGVYLGTNFLNFLLIVGYLCVRDGSRLLSAVRRLYLPVIPWEVATGILTAGTVLAYQEVGVLAIAMLSVMLFSYRYLLASVIDAQRQRDELRREVDELEALHHGVIRVMVETLGMRDRMTARHSAAVARFAKATAAAAGLPSRDQELVHTAGLLHDVGKFTFPDHTLTGTRLTEEDWELIRSHPQRGADIVGRVHGYAEVAEIVLCHHERIDGRGYPRHLSGEDIPALSRILAVADCFDVMTARDSYRTPMPFEDAIAELRRVAGTQLDARFVEIFVGIVVGAGVEFQHAEDEDLEAELERQMPRGSAARSVLRP